MRHVRPHLCRPCILLIRFSVNIHTHFIPFILWLINCIPIFNSSSLRDIPETAFITLALICLFSSVVWHTMAGCAHHDGMDLCARIDYVGIGWYVYPSPPPHVANSAVQAYQRQHRHCCILWLPMSSNSRAILPRLLLPRWCSWQCVSVPQMVQRSSIQGKISFPPSHTKY